MVATFKLDEDDGYALTTAVALDKNIIKKSHTRTVKNKMKEKLKNILQKENSDNYQDFDFQSSDITSHRERLLARIEYAVFGNAKIQKEEFKKFCKRHPEYKYGLKCYKEK